MGRKQRIMGLGISGNGIACFTWSLLAWSWLAWILLGASLELKVLCVCSRLLLDVKGQEQRHSAESNRQCCEGYSPGMEP